MVDTEAETVVIHQEAIDNMKEFLTSDITIQVWVFLVACTLNGVLTSLFTEMFNKKNKRR